MKKHPINVVHTLPMKYCMEHQGMHADGTQPLDCHRRHISLSYDQPCKMYRVYVDLRDNPEVVA